MIQTKTMKKVLPKHTGDKPEPRANSKGASINGRHYIIGGVSKEGPETIIYSFVVKNRNPYELEWRKQNVSNIQVFTIRHSFAVTALEDKIYIFGGDSMQTGQSLGDLIEYNTSKQSLRRLETKGQAPVPRNSASLVTCQSSGELLLFGGVNSKENIPKFPLGLHRFQVSTSTWRFQPLTIQCYDQGIWQHTAHLVNNKLILASNDKNKTEIKKEKIIGLDFGMKQNEEKTVAHKISKINIGDDQEIIRDTECSQQKQEQPKINQKIKKAPINSQEDNASHKGPFLVVIGGCFHPNNPYNQITQIDINSGQIVQQTFFNPIVGHDSVLYKDELFIFGGSDGTAIVETVATIGSQIKEQKGFCGIGPVGFAVEKEIILYGGINVLTNPETFNNALILYESESK